MKIEINIEKKHLYIIVGAILLTLSIFLVNAYNTNTPSVMGHTPGEIDPGTFGSGTDPNTKYIFLNPVQVEKTLIVGKPDLSTASEIFIAGSELDNNIGIANLGGLGLFQFKDYRNTHFYSDKGGIYLPEGNRLFLIPSDANPTYRISLFSDTNGILKIQKGNLPDKTMPTDIKILCVDVCPSEWQSIGTTFNSGTITCWDGMAFIDDSTPGENALCYQ